MNAPRLLAHFDAVLDTPGAVQRLRRFILDLAVRGKLVPQDPNDEPASELLRRIEEKKVWMIERGEIRKPRDYRDPESLSAPFDTPSCWLWVGLGTVGAIVGGGTPDASDADNFTGPGTGFPWLTPADLGRDRKLFISRGARDLTEQGIRTSSAKRMPAGTVLFTSRAPIGYVAIARNPISTNQGFKSVVPYVQECSRFIAVVLMAFAPEIDASAPGTTFREVSGKIIARYPFPLPPLAEQRRIVARVDELTALCDRLDAAIAEREATRDRFAAASLARLNAPEPDPVTVRSHAGFAIENFDRITTRSDQIKTLRRTILNLAVRGALVAQDPNDEPASEYATRKINCHLDTAPFDLPRSWTWAKVGAVAKSRLGKMLDRTKNRGTPHKYLRNINVRWFDFDLTDLSEMRLEDSELSELSLRYGDVLICEGGEPGRAAVWDERETGIYFQKAIHRVRFRHFVNPRYFVLSLRASADDGRLEEYFTGTGIRHFTGKGLARYLFPLPPLAEQCRIVARVDELMALCDRLEERLITMEGAGCRLLDAMLHEALEPGTGGGEEAPGPVPSAAPGRTVSLRV